jgi:hypothetical protein
MPEQPLLVLLWHTNPIRAGIHHLLLGSSALNAVYLRSYRAGQLAVINLATVDVQLSATHSQSELQSLGFGPSDELVQLVLSRPQWLTLVFDQSLGRGREPVELAEKLRHLAAQNVSAFAYQSHACFLVAGADSSLVEHARAQILQQSRLPEARFVTVSQPG